MVHPPPFEQQFVDAESIPWAIVGTGLRRKVLTYDANLMLVLVEFESGAVGAVHQHPHVQMSYVQRGTFAITIGEDTRMLTTGDAFYIPPDTLHGAVCHEAGTLVDVFSPMRADFV
jgi:quercetin dioxygenase-like cupin family protein